VARRKYGFGPRGRRRAFSSVSLSAYVATEGDPAWGGLLLFVYGLGLGVPVLLPPRWWRGSRRIGLGSGQRPPQAWCSSAWDSTWCGSRRRPFCLGKPTPGLFTASTRGTGHRGSAWRWPREWRPGAPPPRSPPAPVGRSDPGPGSRRQFTATRRQWSTSRPQAPRRPGRCPRAGAGRRGAAPDRSPGSSPPFSGRGSRRRWT
jgi:hypothetical protein